MFDPFHVESVNDNGFRLSCERKMKKRVNEKAFYMKGTSPYDTFHTVSLHY